MYSRPKGWHRGRVGTLPSGVLVAMEIGVLNHATASVPFSSFGTMERPNIQKWICRPPVNTILCSFV